MKSKWKNFIFKKKQDINHFIKQKWESFKEGNYDNYWQEEYKGVYGKYKILKENQFLHKQLCNCEILKENNNVNKTLELQENLKNLIVKVESLNNSVTYLKGEIVNKEKEISTLNNKFLHFTNEFDSKLNYDFLKNNHQIKKEIYYKIDEEVEKINIKKCDQNIITNILSENKILTKELKEVNKEITLLKEKLNNDNFFQKKRK